MEVIYSLHYVLTWKEPGDLLFSKLCPFENFKKIFVRAITQ